LVEKSEEKRALGRYNHRWENNIRMRLEETGWQCGDRIHMFQSRDQWLISVIMVQPADFHKGQIITGLTD
jgi:hypothetical protein